MAAICIGNETWACLKASTELALLRFCSGISSFSPKSIWEKALLSRLIGKRERLVGKLPGGAPRLLTPPRAFRKTQTEIPFFSSTVKRTESALCPLQPARCFGSIRMRLTSGVAALQSLPPVWSSAVVVAEEVAIL